VLSRSPGRNPRQVFGGMVRFYREQAGLSRTELARQICKSESLVEAIELGQRATTPLVAGDLENALQARGALARLREEIGYQAHPAWFQDWTTREAVATILRSFEPLIVPGMLQTEGYARAILRTRFGITDDEVEELVAARLKRQEILTRKEPVGLWAILDESLLLRPVGGPDVMLQQVNRLVDATRQPHIAIEVIPTSTGAHEGLSGAFMIADFDDMASVGYQEGVMHGQPVEEPKELAALELVWDTLRGDALPRKASVAVLEEVARSWTSAT